MVRSEQDVWSYGFSTASIIGVAGEKRQGSCSETLEGVDNCPALEPWSAG